MKQFNIKNKTTGIEFQVTRETLEPIQPEWGTEEEREVVVTEIQPTPPTEPVVP